ncbi:hypothetical protein [Halopenitus persicus]|uniref:hypothetical protein n=1 Tax=Halopenitus persicus TaxID=1048396 RepID=UPI0012FE1E9A|nr:hypothetical protein [Halopenitus persicus]
MGHSHAVPVSDHTYHEIEYQAVVTAIADHVGLGDCEVDERQMPRYVTATTEDGINIYLIVSPSDYRGTVNTICMETLITDTPTLLITPEDTVGDLLEIQSLFAGGHLIYTIPFTMLTEDDLITHHLAAIQSIEKLESDLTANRHSEETTPLITRLRSNPRYILTELNEMKLLRLNNEIASGKGTRLEKVAEAAFSHLFPTYPDAGGEDDVGEILPDTLFRISGIVPPKEYDTILGVVDTKSGATGNFGSEKTTGKHDVYLRRARRESVPADWIAHTFVVLGFDGQKEIDFHDDMYEAYDEYDGYLLILTADALGTILAAYLSFVVSNDLRLMQSDFRKAIYPLFHKPMFNSSPLSDITREVGRNEEEYDSEYKKRPELLIVTREVVLAQLERCLDMDGDIERILEGYYQPELFPPA